MSSASPTRGKKRLPTPQNITDYGKVLGSRLECKLYYGIEEQMEIFNTWDCKHGFWQIAKKGKVAAKIVSETLEDEFKGLQVVFEKQADGNSKPVFRRYGRIPEIVKRPSFYKAITDDVCLKLMRMPTRVRDGEHSRGLLMDKDGIVWDILADKFFANFPGVRMGMRTGWSFLQEWGATPEQRRRLTEIIEKVITFWGGDGRKAKGKSLENDPVFGKQICDAYKEWIREVGEDVAFFHSTLLGVYDDNLDEFLWEILHLVSYTMAHSARCEWTYEWGAGNSGKDMQHGVTVAFLGDTAKGGYTSQISSGVLTSLKQSDPNGTQSVLHSCMNKRYCYFNELKFDARAKDRFFNAEQLKDLCEQEGTGLKTRTLYQEPENWNPMCGIVGTGNPPLPLTEEQCGDTGTRRRINYSKMPREFSLQEDKMLKKEINKGKCNPELLFMCKLLAPYVATCGKRIEPRPPRIVKETNDLLSMSLQTDVKTYIESNFVAVENPHDATAQTKVRAIIGRAFPSIGEQCEAYLRKLGVDPERVTRIRYYTYTFPGKPHPEAMKYVEIAEEEGDQL